MFIYTVNKQDIFNQLAQVELKLKQNETMIAYDPIIPGLLEKLRNQELANMYPYRGLLVYILPKKEEHEK